jgi:hypothetical protein
VKIVAIATLVGRMEFALKAVVGLFSTRNALYRALMVKVIAAVTMNINKFGHLLTFDADNFKFLKKYGFF